MRLAQSSTFPPFFLRESKYTTVRTSANNIMATATLPTQADDPSRGTQSDGEEDEYEEWDLCSECGEYHEEDQWECKEDLAFSLFGHW